MIRVRTAMAALALLVLGVLVVTAEPTGPPIGRDRLTVALWSLLPVLAVTLIGLLRRAYWSRWLALGGAIAILPWATALTVAPGPGMSVWRQSLALAAALALLLSLPGSAMTERFEGGTIGRDRRDRRFTLVRWAVICNIASVLALYLFATVYKYQVSGYAVITAVLMLGLLVGVLMLAHGRTVGLLAVAACCLLLVPSGAFFVWSEARYPGEAILFVLLFLPGVLTGLASLIAFWRPMRKYVGSD